MTITIFAAWISNFGYSWLNRDHRLPSVERSCVSAICYDLGRNPFQPAAY